MQLTESRRTVLAVVGNPKPASRTRTVAEAVAQLIADAVEGDGPPVAVEVMEVAELGPHLLGWGDPVAAEALDRLLSADALVIASPVFKATYTGLLKLLLDQVGQGQLAGVPAVPLMVGAGPAHAMAVDAHMRPLLVELGASCPTAGLYVLDSTLDQLGEVLAPWAEAWVPALAAAITARTLSEVPA